MITHAESRGLGAALRTGLEHARDAGYAAAVYLDGDGEYDAAELARVLEPVARGRADYVLGSRFLGAREGMTWHRDLANRATTALLGTLMGTVLTDGQTGYRAFSAQGAARRAHQPRLQLRAGADAVAVGRGHRSGRGADQLPPPLGRALVRVLPGVLRARDAGALAPVPRLQDGQGQRAPRRSRRPARTARPIRRSAGTARSAGRTARPAGARPARPSPAAPPGRATPTTRWSAPPAPTPVRGSRRRPQATSGTASASAASMCRGGNQ